MRHSLGNKLLIMAAVVGLGVAGATTNPGPSISDAEIARKLVHEIRMYPRYTIFDDIQVKVTNGKVDLLGAVSQPFKKDDMGRIAQRVEGVTGVSNELKVLPLSNFDNRLRLQVAQAIYRDPVLSRYGWGALPSIHIIVDNGHVTLEGEVNSEMDRNLAAIRANAAGMSFGQVTNNLKISRS